jgi:TonB family protein
MHRLLLISLISTSLFLCLSGSLYGQNRIYYDRFFKDQVETKTNYYRELTIADSTAAVKEVCADTVMAQGSVRYGKHAALINDFAHFMKSYGNPYQLKKEFEDMRGEIDYYKDGRKERKIVSYSAKMYHAQIWSSDGRELLTQGNGEHVYTEKLSTFHQYFKDSVMVEMFEVRNATQDTLYYTYDRLAEPVEGYTSFSQELARILKYPGLARLAGKEGLVYVQFIVAKDGRLSEFKPLTKEGFNLEKKAVEKLSKMPNWRPALFKGKPVKMKFTIPIRFRLT